MRSVTSSLISVTSGIMQRSSFGPTLFFGYINNINSVIKSSKLHLLADDFKISKGIIYSSNHLALKTDIDTVFVWYQLWDPPLNMNKLVHTHMSYRTTNQHYQCNRKIIQQEAIHKDLGVIFINDISIKSHIKYGAKKAHKLFYMAFHSFSSRDPFFRGSVFQLFIRLSLEYASSVWRPSIKQNIQAIERVLRWFSKRIPSILENNYTKTQSNAFT